MPIILSKPHRKHYHAPLCSKTYFIYLAVWAATLILPLFFAYSSHSFWLKENSYRETPSLTYKKQAVFKFDGLDNQGNQLDFVWATDAVYNYRNSERVRIPILKTWTTTTNTEITSFNFDIQVPLIDGEVITNIQLAFIFQYQLSSLFTFTMESLALYDFSPKGHSIYIDADLHLQQRELFNGNIPLRPSNNFDELTKPVFSIANLTDWKDIVSSYLDRSVRTDVHITPVYKQSNSLHITGKLRVGEERIMYIPGLSEVLKNAWIQYVCYLLVVGTVFYWVFGELVGVGVLGSYVGREELRFKK